MCVSVGCGVWGLCMGVCECGVWGCEGVEYGGVWYGGVGM